MRLLRGNRGEAGKGRVHVGAPTNWAKFDGQGEIWVVPEIKQPTVQRAGLKWGPTSMLDSTARSAYQAEGEAYSLNQAFKTALTVFRQLQESSAKA